MEKRKMKRKIIISVILNILLLFNVVNAEELNLSSQKYILYNLNEDEVLLEKDANEKASIASLTKIMTVLVAVENIDDFDEKVTITSEMLNGIDWDVQVVGLKVGEKLSYNDLLYSSMLASGADAVNALAFSIGGSKSKFVDLMNKKAKELNLKNTKFANPIGLYDENNYSTASDVAEILKYALKNKKFKEIFETKRYTLSNGKEIKSTIESYNQRLNENITYITGSKTGYINAAGYCLATTATLNDVNYLLITLNAPNTDPTAHIKDHVKTYNYYNDNYSYKNIVNKEDVVVTLKTKYAREKNIDIYSNIEINDYLDNNFDKSKIEYEYDGIDKISYFTKKGTKLGKITINYEGKTLNEFDLIYNQTLSFSLISFLWINKFYVIIIVIVLYLFYRYKKVQRIRRKRRLAKLKQNKNI